MNIFSFEFLILLAASFILYYLVYLLNKAVKKVIVSQWIVLLAASLTFYGFNNWIYLVYLGASSLISYLSALFCLKSKKIGKIFTIIAIILNVGALAVLKYFNFFSISITSLFNLNEFTYNFIVPLGISFYTFSLIAYNVDCYKGITVSEKNPLKFLLFVSYFPKILQGPISSYDKLKEDGLFSPHSFIDNNYLNSFFRIGIGLIKKIAIANVINIYVNNVFTHLSDVYGLTPILTIVLYAIQLYCDFSGFMDICIGVSGLFGINLEENFKTPYLSISIQDFWRRWHITLGVWLKKYIYIPLGGNRVSIFRWIINTLLVWLVSGIWHGANWTYVVWGLYHGALLVLFSLPTQIKKKKGTYVPEERSNIFMNIWRVTYTFLLVCFGWIFFRSSDIGEAGRYIGNMFQVWRFGTYDMFSDVAVSNVSTLFIISLSLVMFLIIISVLSTHKEYFENKINGYNKVVFVSKFIVTALFISFAIFTYMYMNSFGGNESSFIYFNF